MTNRKNAAKADVAAATRLTDNIAAATKATAKTGIPAVKAPAKKAAKKDKVFKTGTAKPRAGAVKKKYPAGQFFSVATGRPVSKAWALKNPTKAFQGVKKLPKGATLDTSSTPVVVESAVNNVAVAKKTAKKAVKKAAAKKTLKASVETANAALKKAGKKTIRVVKRDIVTGEFATSKSRKSTVVPDIIKAPDQKKAAKKTAVKKTSSDFAAVAPTPSAKK